MNAGRRIAWVILVVSLISVFAGTVAPQPAIAWLRNQLPFFAWGWDSLDAVLPWFNPLHILLYAWLAAMWRSLTPSRSSRSILLLGGVFASISESLQLLAPGRTARVSDVVNDLLGITIGLIVAAMIRKVWPLQRDPDK